MEFAERLQTRFGKDVPIMTDEVLAAWREYSRPRVFQLLKEAVDKGLLAKYEQGVYYVPAETLCGKSTLSRRKVIEKKYIRAGNEVYGYYGGLTLLNGLGLTTQMPNRLEVISSRASAIVRQVEVGNAPIKLRRARVQVNKDNVYALELLEAFNEIDMPLSEGALRRVKEFVLSCKMKRADVFAYAGVFPGKAIKNLISSGVENVFA